MEGYILRHNLQVCLGDDGILIEIDITNADGLMTVQVRLETCKPNKLKTE